MERLKLDLIVVFLAFMLGALVERVYSARWKGFAELGASWDGAITRFTGCYTESTVNYVPEDYVANDTREKSWPRQLKSMRAHYRGARWSG